MLRRALPALALALLLPACTSGGPDPQAAPSAPVLQPGLPGEESEVVDADDVQAPAEAEPGEADVAYVGDMLVHHAQALVMAQLAPERAGDPGVKALAERIAAGQGPEMDAMRAWLERHDADVPDAPTTLSAWTREGSGHGGHGSHGGGSGAAPDHGDMPGMATPAQLRELADSRGAAFDRLFLRLMTAHHEGALRMVQTELAEGREQVALEMAQDVGATQSTEVRRMRELLATVSRPSS